MNDTHHRADKENWRTGCFRDVEAGQWRSFRALAFACTLLVACGTPSDEERLKELVDTSPTHFYAALKIAMGPKVEDAPESQPTQSRERLRELIAALEAQLSTEPPGQVDAEQLLTVGKLLWKLRTMGATEVRKWRTSTLSVLPARNATGRLDLPTERAILLLGLVALRLHPKSPTPIPDTALLYEAYLLGNDKLSIPALEGVARSAQALTFAQHELCELAAASTEQLATLPPATNGTELATLAGSMMGLGRVAAHAPPAAGLAAAVILAQNLPWAVRLLAHAATAQCLTQRDAREPAGVEWDRALKVAKGAGFPPSELAFLRAYIAYEARDFGRVHQQLKVAQQSPLLDEQARNELDELVEHFDPEDRAALDAYFDSLVLARWTTLMVHHRLKQAGFYEELQKLPALQTFSALMKAAEPHSAIGLWEKGYKWLLGLLR